MSPELREALRTAIDRARRDRLASGQGQVPQRRPKQHPWPRRRRLRRCKLCGADVERVRDSRLRFTGELMRHGLCRAHSWAEGLL